MAKKLLFLLAWVIVYTSCEKGEAVENIHYTKVTVAYKDFVESPPVVVSIDTAVLGEMNAGNVKESLFESPVKPMTISVKDLNGQLLLDSTFTPGNHHQFTLFISELLGIREFYTAPQTQPDSQHYRIQLFHKIVAFGVQKNATFKFFIDRNGDASVFEPTYFELKNVPFGKLSAPVDLPALSGAAYYAVKAYDAATGDIILDLFEGFPGYGAIPPFPGQHVIINVVTVDDPDYGPFYDIFQAYQL